MINNMIDNIQDIEQFTVLESISELQSIYEDLVKTKSLIKVILENTEEGIFFIDQRLNVENQYSKPLSIIFNQEKLSGHNFISLLEARAPTKIVEETEGYLNLMFRNDLEEETINELNPLSEVEFHFEDEQGLWISSRHYSILFKRIYQDGKIIKLFSTVKDITAKNELSKKLNDIQKNNKRQIEWLGNIMHVELPLLQEFINVSENEIHIIEKELQIDKGSDEFTSKLNKILRTLRQLKNNASLLNLSLFLTQIKKFESSIIEIKEKKEILGNDFVPAVIKLGILKKMITEIKELMRLKYFKNSLQGTDEFKGHLRIRTIEKSVQTLSEEFEKKISFNYEKFNSKIIPFIYKKIVIEFLIILIRFSIIFGIEKPKERKAANKNPTGTLEIETFTKRKIVGFKLRHDGRLVRIERLLQKTIDNAESDLFFEKNNTESDHLGSEVIQLLFMPNMLTSNLIEAEYSKKIFRDMELVKRKLKLHGGKIKITFTSEQYCEYIISLPLNQ